MDQIVEKKKHCERCNGEQLARLVRIISASGVSMVSWNCIAGSHAIDRPMKYISHETIRATTSIDIDRLPVMENYSGREICAVCGNPYTELHHFAPRHLFGNDADNWPMAYLCKKHHDLWHAIVTPNMGKVKYGFVQDSRFKVQPEPQDTAR